MGQNTRSTHSIWTIAFIICAIALLIRTLTIGLYPLQDTSEARYAEMARLMVETNDWITVWFNYNVPFWGKPPLFIWLSAISFKLFGINEFAARFPSILVSLGILWFTWRLARFQMGREAARIALLILTTTTIFLTLSGSVLAEPVLLLSIIMIQSGFWIGWHSEDPSEAHRWQYLFFIGCAVALLAKGLAAIVLAGLPIFCWCLPQQRLLKLWQKFPWIKGTLLTLLIAAPWYIAAEIKTPGFLDYFIVGEHFRRYLDSGWAGDLYGTAHVRPLGSIWLLWLQSGFPWTLVFIFIAAKLGVNRLKGQPLSVSRWSAFLLLTLMCPLVFFTFSKNLIWTYALPAAPALALLLAERWKNSWPQHPKRIIGTALLTPILVSVLTVFLIQGEGQPSHKQILATAKQQNLDNPVLLYWQKPSFSARFYSEGKIIPIESTQHLQEVIANPDQQYFLLIRNRSFEGLPAALRHVFNPVSHYRDDTLYLKK